MGGFLERGKWYDGWYDTRASRGELVRTASRFRNWITADGSSGFAAEPGRYHLYVSLACPWAHRTLIARALKGLDEVISVSVVEPVLTQGWAFSKDLPDHLHGSDQSAYERAFDRLFAALDRVEAELAGRPFLVGQQATEADWRLFTTLVRFDAVW